MEMSESDIQKIESIEIVTRVTMFLEMLSAIDGKSLARVLDSMQNDESPTLRNLLAHTLDFKNKVKRELETEREKHYESDTPND